MDRDGVRRGDLRVDGGELAAVGDLDPGEDEAVVDLPDPTVLNDPAVVLKGWEDEAVVDPETRRAVADAATAGSSSAVAEPGIRR